MPDMLRTMPCGAVRFILSIMLKAKTTFVGAPGIKRAKTSEPRKGQDIGEYLSKLYPTKYRLNAVTLAMRKAINSKNSVKDALFPVHYYSNIRRIEYEIGKDDNLQTYFNEEGQRIIRYEITESGFELQFNNFVVIKCRYLNGARQYAIRLVNQILFDKVLNDPYVIADEE